MSASRETFVRRFGTYFFGIEGLLSAHAVDATVPAADGGPGRFGDLVYVPVNLLIGDLRLVRATPGSSGTTTVDIYRLRTGAWTLVGTLTVTGTTPMAVSNVSMDATAAATTINAGDILMARLRTIEAGAPAGLTVSIELR